MAEEKKFLEETMEQPKNKKLVVKNVVLAFVVFVILLLCVLAWFTSRSDASASGLSLKTSGENGLEVSLDGGEHWDTKWDSRGVTGWRKSDILAKYDSTNGGSLMQLLSGNGQDLYYTKSVDANGDVKDSDFVKISDDKAGDYCLEFEAYFRSENKCQVSLTNQSKVEPYDLTETERNNSFGFSPDYIAGASRVAFLEKRGTESAPTWAKTGLWIPNPKYQLTTTSSENVKYTKMPDNYGGSVSTSTGGSVTGDFPPDYSGPKYYLWTSSKPMSSSLSASENAEVLRSMYAVPLIPIEGREGAYYCQFYTLVPSAGRNEQIFLINDSNAEKSWESTAQGSNMNGFLSCAVAETNFDGTYWNIDNNTFTLSLTKNGATKPDDFNYENYTFRKIYYNTLLPFDETASRLIRFVYEPNVENGKVTFATPGKNDVTISNNENTGKLKQGETIVVTRTSGEAVKGMHNDLTAVDPLFASGRSSCDLQVASYEEDSNGVRYYKFSNTSTQATSKYLSVDSSGKLTVSDESNASYFYIVTNGNTTTDEKGNTIHEKLLAYISTDSQGNKSIRYVTLSSDGKRFELSSSYGTGYMIYQKTTTSVKNYGILTDGTPETEDESWGKTYYYFDGATKASLESSEYMTSLDDREKNKNLVKLETRTPMGDKTYYTGKMKVRIYAEGFDREAQKPMEKGKIKVNLQFTATTIS